MEREIESTRRQIVNLLRQRGGMTAKDLAAALAITSVGVRRHLARLEQEGLARATLVRQKMGRPTYVYVLTEQAQDLFPKNYQTLATQLLDAVSETKGEDAVNSIFAARMSQLLRQYRPRMEGKDLAARVQELARIQEEAGYMAVWEKSGEGFLLKEQNCAIYGVACRFQQACHFEIELFRRLLDADITRLEHQIKGERCCTYLVLERRAAGLVSKMKRQATVKNTVRA
jgi:predicted ArsR family transcriptional regulator